MAILDFEASAARLVKPQTTTSPELTVSQKYSELHRHVFSHCLGVMVLRGKIARADTDVSDLQPDQVHAIDFLYDIYERLRTVCDSSDVAMDDVQLYTVMMKKLVENHGGLTLEEGRAIKDQISESGYHQHIPSFAELLARRDFATAQGRADVFLDHKLPEHLQREIDTPGYSTMPDGKK